MNAVEYELYYCIVVWISIGQFPMNRSLGQRLQTIHS